MSIEPGDFIDLGKAAIIAVIEAVILLLGAFGVVIDVEQSVAIIGVVNALGGLALAGLYAWEKLGGLERPAARDLQPVSESGLHAIAENLTPGEKVVVVAGKTP